MSAVQSNVANMRLVAENDELTVRVAALIALSETPVTGLVEYIEAYQDIAAKIAEEATRANYPGIFELWMYYQEGVDSLSRGKTTLDAEEHEVLSSWPRLIMAYLQEPGVLDNRDALITHLRHPLLALPIRDNDAAVLSMMLDEGEPGKNSGIDESGVDSDYDSPVSYDDEISLDDTDEGITDMAGAFLPYDDVLSLPSKELVSTLISQLTVMQEPLNKLQAIILSSKATPEDIQAAVGVYAGYLERFGEASREVGLIGLYEVCRHVDEYIRGWAVEDSTSLNNMSDVQNDFITKVRSYLLAPYIEGNSSDLVNYLCHAVWPHPISSEEAMNLLPLFQDYTQPEDKIEYEQADSDTEDQQESESQPIATAEDVSLELPDDVDQELFEIMLEELPEQTAQFSEAVQNLIKGGSLEDVKVAQRMAHSLKGAGNTIGVKGVASLTHHLEDILIKFSEQERLPTWSLSLTMMKAVDCLEGMGEALNGDSSPPDDAREVLQEILDWVGQIDREGLPQEDGQPVDMEESDDLNDDSQSLSIDLSALSDSLSSDTLSASGAMSALTDSMSAMPALLAKPKRAKRKNGSHDSATIRVPASLVDNLLRLAGEATIMTGLMHERVRQTIGQIQNLQNEFSRMRALGADLERLVDIKDFSAEKQSSNTRTDFDSLEMDQYNELHTYSRMLAETATDSQELGYQVKQELMSLEDMLVDQDLLNHETQDSVMDVRMVPVKSIVSKLQRSVRQTARLTDKQINLQVNGEDTLMDGDVLADLADPLMHLLRNAIDHGIESAEQRKQSGKSIEGHILMEFLREGNNILVRCKDDGAGIDFGAIQHKAETLGILQRDQKASEDELKRILLLSNFSTRSEVTQTSGRGVGLDAVYSKVIEMGGSLALESESGVGTLFEIRVPLTLISSHALLVRQGPTLLAISDHGVLQILYGKDGELQQEGDDVFYKLGEQRYPARFLETILDLPSDRRDSDRSKRPVFLVQDEMGISAVIVGEVLESLNIVVKDFGQYVPSPAGIAGAAILGDGSVKPVIDLPDLLRHARSALIPMMMVPERTEASRSSRKMVMVVDDSRSARYVLTKVIEAAGYIVRSARDGVEAISLLEARPADIVLSDMEMPRMNGIELTEHMRSSSLLSHIPVIMITSRSTVKHREEAEAAGVKGYFNKPFDEEGLVGAVESLLA